MLNSDFFFVWKFWFFYFLVITHIHKHWGLMLRIKLSSWVFTRHFISTKPRPRALILLFIYTKMYIHSKKSEGCAWSQPIHEGPTWLDPRWGPKLVFDREAQAVDTGVNIIIFRSYEEKQWLKAKGNGKPSPIRN